MLREFDLRTGNSEAVKTKSCYYFPASFVPISFIRYNSYVKTAEIGRVFHYDASKTHAHTRFIKMGRNVHLFGKTHLAEENGSL